MPVYRDSARISLSDLGAEAFPHCNGHTLFPRAIFDFITEEELAEIEHPQTALVALFHHTQNTRRSILPLINHKKVAKED